MKHLIEYLIESSIKKNNNALISVLSTNDANKIKTYIANVGIKFVLSSFSTYGVPNTKYTKSIFATKRPKANTEYMRGDISGTQDGFDEFLNILFTDTLKLDKNNEWTVISTGVHKTVSSNSRISAHININFKYGDNNEFKYTDNFYICNKGMNYKGENVILSDKILTPAVLVDTTLEYNNIEKLKTDVLNNLKNILSKSDDNFNQYVDMFSAMIDSIIYNQVNKNVCDVESILNAKHSFQYVLDFSKLEDSEIYNKLDTTSKNNICAIFAEILSGFILYNISPNSNFTIKYPGNNEPINDLYFNGVGISVKRKSSSSGHLPEVSSIANLINNALEEFGIKDGENISNKQLNNIKEKIGIDVDSETLAQFKSDIKTFYLLDNNGKNTKRREEILWDIAFNTISDNVYFKKILNMLGITQRTECNETDIFATISDFDIDTYNEFIDTCIKLSGISGKEKIDRTWIVNPINAKERERNYSKIMRALQLAVCDTLNRRYTKSDDNVADLFSVFVQNSLGSLQCYIDITTNKSGNILNFSIENMSKAKYVFKPAGSTWNEWKSHGNIGFKIK